MTDRELLNQALYALEYIHTETTPCEDELIDGAIKALRARLAQPENKFNPDWDAMAVMVEEQQRMAKRVEELEAQLAQPEPEPEKSQDKPCVEDDGCPTEKAVLQRFWREHQAQPEQEPVAWADRFDIDRDGHDFWVNRQEPAKDGVPLYTAQPQREWVGLTDKEIEDCLEMSIQGTCRAIEAKLKEKNG